MTHKKLYRIFLVCVGLLALTSWFRSLEPNLTDTSFFREALSFTLQATVHVGIVVYWAITVNRRIMHKPLKAYLLLFASFEVFWFVIRNIKWRAFENEFTTGRILWYMYYIPMLVLPIIGLFIALTMNKDEKFRLSKKWYFLLIPTICLIMLVLTNDLHYLVFSFPKGDQFWYTNKMYELGYVILMTWISNILVVGVLIIYKQWRLCNRSRLQYLPIVTLVINCSYVGLYISGNKIINNFIDLTTFDCLMFILFWEACIQVGLIRSNSNHIAFFENAKISAALLDKKGNLEIKSLDTKEVTPTQFIQLKTTSEIQIDENEILSLSRISHGYVVWWSDISDIVAMNKQLYHLNNELYGEVVLLEKETQLKEERFRIDKLNHIYDLIGTEIMPSMLKITELVQKSQGMQPVLQDDVLKKINIISCYVKRKINLLLQIDEDKPIQNVDMQNGYREIFRGLALFGITFDMNYNAPLSTTPSIHLLCYDLFEHLLEKVDFNLELVYINCMEDRNTLRFTINTIAHIPISQNSFDDFRTAEIQAHGGNIKVYDNSDSVDVVLLFSKEMGVA